MKIIFKNNNTILFCISVLLFAYTSYRAFVLSITWDEAFSYLEYIQHNIFIEKRFGEMSANNHLLNTWLCILLLKVFSVSEFILRIPSLIAHIIFLVSSAQLVVRFSNKWLIISSFLIINCNPYVLDFFSLSRGYGLSISFMLLSLHHLINYLSKEYKLKYALFSIVAGGFAVLSNFVLLNYFVVLFLLFSFFLLIKFIKEKEHRLKNTIYFIVIENSVILILLFIVPITFKLRTAGALFYGGDYSFWSDTVSTSVISCLYGLSYGHWVVVLLKLILLATLGVSAAYLFLKFRKKEFETDTIIIFSLLFLITATAALFVAQHHLLHTLYLMDRTTIFYIVLFNVLLVYVVNIVFKNKKIVIPVHLILLGLTLFHFVLCFNFSYVWEWKINANMKEMAEDIEKNKEPITSESPIISVGTPLIFESGLNYYRVTRKWHWLNPLDRTEQTNEIHRFWFLEADSVLEEKNINSYKIANTYSLSKGIFIKTKNAPRFSKVVLRSTLDYSFSEKGVYKLVPENLYSQGFSIDITDSMLGENGKGIITVKYKMKVPYAHLGKTALVISLQNENGVYLWKCARVKEYIQNEDGWNEVSFFSIIPKGVKAGDVLKSYIWNESTKNIFIDKAEIKWLENTNE